MDTGYLRHWLPMGATLATPTVATLTKRHWLPQKKGQWLERNDAFTWKLGEATDIPIQVIIILL